MTARYSVWLGHRASIWSHRGYRVRGERVECSSMRDARRIVRVSLCGIVPPRSARYVSVTAEDGVYCYSDRAAMNRDDTGARADAVISRRNQDES